MEDITLEQIRAHFAQQLIINEHLSINDTMHQPMIDAIDAHIAQQIKLENALAKHVSRVAELGEQHAAMVAKLRELKSVPIRFLTLQSDYEDVPMVRKDTIDAILDADDHG